MTRNKLLIQAVAELIIEKPDNTDQTLQGLKKILARRGRIRFPNVLEKIIEVVAERLGINQYRVTSAQPLRDTDKECILGIIDDAKSDVSYYCNERLLGGATIKTKDKVLDLSIKNKIEKIKRAIVVN